MVHDAQSPIGFLAETSTGVFTQAVGAAGGTGLLAMLGTPGVGTGLLIGATFLSSLFGRKSSAELAQFQSEVQRQENEKNRARQRSSESQREIGRASEVAISAEQGQTAGTLSALRHFFG